MNKRALLFGVLYSIFVIIFKLVILLGGYTLSKFGFYYSHVVSVICIVPFFYLAIRMVRDKDYNGFIGGKESVRISLTVLAVAMLITSIYNYIEFNWMIKDISIGYYQGQEYHDILVKQQAMHPDKIKVESFPAIVEEQIRDLSAFKATTGKLIPLLFMGLAAAFITSMLIKKSVVKN